MKISFANTTDLVILHPVDKKPCLDDDGKPMTLSVYGSMSKQWRKIRNAHLNDAMLRKADEENDAAPQTFEEVEVRSCELLARSIADIGNCTELQTDEHPEGLTKENCEQFLVDTPWLRDQIDSVIADLSLFIQNESKKKPKKA